MHGFAVGPSQPYPCVHGRIHATIKLVYVWIPKHEAMYSIADVES